MKKKISLILIVFCVKVFSQNIKCEMVDYINRIDSKQYSTYQYINSSYSYSRPLIVLITSEKNFMIIHQKIPKIYSSKQEYTDVYLLGIEGFDKNTINDTDKKIIDVIIKKIEKYRKDNDLIPISEETIISQVKYLSKAEDVCLYFACKKK